VIAAGVLAVFASTSTLAATLTVEEYTRAVHEAYARFKDVNEGANADYIPILATVPSEMFGIVAVGPGKFAIATFSPPLNPSGNSVLGLKAINYIGG